MPIRHNTIDAESGLLRSPPRQYVAALVGVAAATIVRLLLDSWLGERAPFVLYLVPLSLVAWRYGRGPLIVAAIVSTFCGDYFFVHPKFSFGLDNWVEGLSIGIFLLVLLVVRLTSQREKSMRDLAEKHARQTAQANEQLREKSSEVVHLNLELRSRTEQLAEQARLLDLSSDAIIVRDAEDRITFWNEGAREMYGWTKEEAIGQVIYKLLKTEFPEPLPQIMTKLRRMHRWNGELIHTRRDGSRIVVSTRWALDDTRKDHPPFILETNTDITERRQELVSA